MLLIWAGLTLLLALGSELVGFELMADLFALAAKVLFLLIVAMFLLAAVSLALRPPRHL
jgi:hypothetical protein